MLHDAAIESASSSSEAPGAATAAATKQTAAGSGGNISLAIEYLQRIVASGSVRAPDAEEMLKRLGSLGYQ